MGQRVRMPFSGETLVPVGPRKAGQSMPGLRSGFVAGDAAIVERYHQYRTYQGCALPPPTQAASTGRNRCISPYRLTSCRTSRRYAFSVQPKSWSGIPLTTLISLFAVCEGSRRVSHGSLRCRRQPEWPDANPPVDHR